MGTWGRLRGHGRADHVALTFDDGPDVASTPLFLDLLTGNKVSVGPPFFNATFVPICAPLFAALCVGPYLAWKRAELGPALARLRIAFAVSSSASSQEIRCHPGSGSPFGRVRRIG